MVRPTYTGPAHPVGYVEVQKYIGTLPLPDGRHAANLLQEAWDEMARDQPDLKPHGSRIESVVDGAGVTHCTWYIGFAPKHVSSEPLDPHNLNDAPPPQPGWPEPTDGIMPLGTKESKF